MAPSSAISLVAAALLACSNAAAFRPISSSPLSHHRLSPSSSSLYASPQSSSTPDNYDNGATDHAQPTRRSILTQTASLALSTSSSLLLVPSANAQDDNSNMYSPKFVQTYEDFIDMPEGWSYKDVKIGTSTDTNGDLKDGDRVVFDWSGYTIGYFGRPFEAKG
jgi:hypothetical protein